MDLKYGEEKMAALDRIGWRQRVKASGLDRQARRRRRRYINCIFRNNELNLLNLSKQTTRNLTTDEYNALNHLA